MEARETDDAIFQGDLRAKAIEYYRESVPLMINRTYLKFQNSKNILNPKETATFS